MFNTTRTNYLLLLLLLLSAEYTAIAQTKPQRVFTSATVRDTIYIEGGKVVYHERISSTGQLPAQQQARSLPAGRNIAPSATARSAAPLLISASSTPGTCQRYTGQVTITASGGTPPYTYNMDGAFYQSSAVYFVSGPSTHVMGVKDALGATATTTVSVSNNFLAPTVNIQSAVNPTGCATRDGSVTVAASGGAAPYTYSLDGISFQTSNVFTGLAPGTYYPIVKDANGCTGVYPFISSLSAPGCSRPLGMGYSQYSCTNEGNITITPFWADAPFMLSLDGISYQSSNTLSNLPPGMHTFYIKGNSGQVSLWTIAIWPNCDMVLNATVTKASCGLTDGSITVTVSRGTAPYQYSIDGLNFQSSNAFTGLATGYYIVTVRDANGSVQTQFAEVQDDCPQVTTVVNDALCGASDGVITASPVGGVGPYTYSIDGGSNYQASTVFSGLAPGNYTIMIKDSRGLAGSTQATVKDRCMQFTLTPSSSICGNHNGSIVVNVTNGTAPFQYSLDGSTWQGTPIFNGLASGNYMVTVKDNTSLTITKSVTVANIAGPGIQVTPQPAG
ncbi:SprB repeat-containing protein [Paraflavitalea sp. CAU 1676]|uniref:SprB repeat-containing protein n=1 Tax=Paraflavitalea sp. CAU 1676 TaxID=3032598 RepID=UPI0023DA72A7|nr:SprB repeat-containing protein [Paraflavitalea sp. CAU 1676]MDF2188241.1 SprB repeat-containing protein [Paraflavitalea sp. CAU 1676]